MGGKGGGGESTTTNLTKTMVSSSSTSPRRVGQDDGGLKNSIDKIKKHATIKFTYHLVNELGNGLDVGPCLTPATTDLTGLIDYASKLGQSIYKQGCDKLTKDEGFPMTLATTIAFVKAFENRCSIMGWNHGAQNVTKFLNHDNLMIDMIVRHYRQIAEANLKSGCEEFCKAGAKQSHDGPMPQEVTHCGRVGPPRAVPEPVPVQRG